MSEPVWLALSALSGGALGVIFFGGLWWTIRRGLASSAPALWFLGSLWVRTLAVVAGFYVVAQGDWRRIACCMVGFLGARAAAGRWAATHEMPGKKTAAVGGPR